jgi:NAD(P)-dependent dehydrogenase (short-subunit alcohol dehydrogenase family)
MTDKVAIVTAASKGMGAAIARELARRDYRLAVLSTSDALDTLAREIGAVAVRGSTAEPRDLERLVKTTLERFGRIDAVVNNTGHPPKRELLEISDAEWRLGFDMVLMNVVRMARLVTPHMEKAGGGAIVNISSTGAVEPAFPVSSVGRAGLSVFAKLYAQRYAPAKIRMNNLLPGFNDSWPDTPEVVARIPMGRFGTVAEVAGTVAFLLSPEAAYITGQNIIIDGGMVKGI